MIPIDLVPYTDFVIDKYVNCGLNTVQIADILGCSSSGIGRLLERNGILRIHTPNEIKLTDEQKASICREYVDGQSSEELATVYGVCDGTIRKIVRESGIEIRPAKRRSIIKRHGYFDNIDTVDKAYFLGWLITDGCVVDTHNRPGRAPVVSIEIQSGDAYILNMFADVLGANREAVHCNQKRGHSYFRFSSEEMAADLAKYGVVERKSSITLLPQLDACMMPHLIRGIFDGNGTVTIDRHKYARFAFYGSERICNEICDYLSSEIGINRNKVSKSTCYHVWWGGKTPARLFYDYMYKDCGDYYLRRKKEKFELVL